MTRSDTVRLILPLPPRNNVYYRHSRGITHLSTEGRNYKAQVNTLRYTIQPLEGPVRVSIDVYRKRKAGDLDGFFKGLLDSLNGVAYHDDAQIVELHARRFDDKHDPRVEIEIQELADGTAD